MPTLRTRAGKGSALTHNELDANFKRAVSQKTTTYTTVVGDNRNVIECSSATPFTVTLGAAATMAAAETGDYEVTIANIGSGLVTVARGGSDTIDGAATSLTLPQYSAVTLKVNSAGAGYSSVGQVFKPATAGTVEASKIVTADANKDVTGFRNVTATGTATAATVAATSAMTVGGLAVQSTPAAVTGYVGAGFQTVKNNVPAKSGGFSLTSNLTEGIWVSIGSTSAGATKTWSDLDAVPITAKYIEVMTNCIAVDASTSAYIYAYARQSGDNSLYDNSNCIGTASTVVGGATAVSVETVSTHKIPLIPANGSVSFEAYWRDSNLDTAGVVLYLVGWGV
jgi:hypothetical protein